MKLPAIEIPDESSDKARQWAYRLAVLPFESTVEDVALLIAAAMADRGTCRTCEEWKPAGKRHLCERLRQFTDPDDGCIKGYAPKEAA